MKFPANFNSNEYDILDEDGPLYLYKETFSKWQCNCETEFYTVLKDDFIYSSIRKKIEHEWLNWWDALKALTTCSSCGEQEHLKRIKKSRWTAIDATSFELFLKSHEHLIEPDRKKDPRRCRYKAYETKGICYKKHKHLIANLQDWQCYFCNRDLMTLPDNEIEWDHLNPISRGGSNWPINLVLACKQCNREKGTMNEDEYWEDLKLKHPQKLLDPAIINKINQFEIKKIINRSAKNYNAGRIQLADKQFNTAKELIKNLNCLPPP